ncbi:MAG: hypothetical protein HYX92_03545 [Chloroflexi bacterium]|nr:hypothetical protein [Chloroflexota bacterium]
MKSPERDPRFAVALDECCRRTLQGESLQDCLASHPQDYQEELARLVPVALQPGRLGRDPSAEFQHRLERTLQASLAAERRKQSTGLARLLHFSLAPIAVRLATIALLAILVVVGSSVGALRAAEDSLPDNPLYQVTAAREWAELALATSPDTQINVRVNQVTRRVRELERAVKADRLPVVETLVNRAIVALERIVDKVLQERANGNPRPARRALAAIRRVEGELQRLQGEALPPIAASLEKLRRSLEEQAGRLLEAGNSP